MSSRTARPRRAARDAPLRACPLCDAREIRPFDRDFRGAHIWRCTRCGVRFMNPQYTDAYLQEYYATYIQEELEPPARKARRLAQKRASVKLLERYVSPGRFFSIGCGDGMELAVAKTRGWRVEGFDVDPVTTARVAKKVGATVHTGDLFALPLEAGAYDCVYLDQVLEHPKDPAAYLRLCYHMLRPNGLLYIGVPNIESVASSFKTALGRLGLRRRRRGKHYDTFHHLFYYSPRTLPRLLEERYGFRVEAVRGDPKPRTSLAPLVALRDAVARRVPRLDSSFVVLARRAP